MAIKYRSGFVALLAFAVGTMAANLYYAQPILNLIAKSLGIRPDAAGLVMMMVQVGYGLGVVFIVPLGDLFANKKLILTMITVTIVAEIALGVSNSITPYLVASTLAGLGGSTVQILVPYATHLFDRAERGRIIGSLMSGLMLGILFSRPLASFLTEAFSFHAVFFVSAGMMTLLLWALSVILPERLPESTGLTYGQLIWSMKKLFVEEAILRRRSVYQALMFGAFCWFWTTAPLFLTGSDFHFTQRGVAIFALVGVAGAVVAPLAGRMADRGFGRAATTMAFGSGIVSFLLGQFVQPGGFLFLALLATTANLLDAGVSAHLVLGQRMIFMIDPKNQSRLNGLYVGTIYIGGAFGSVTGAWAYLHWGWSTTCLVGMIFPLAALFLMLTEKFSGYVELELSPTF